LREGWENHEPEQREQPAFAFAFAFVLAFLSVILGAAEGLLFAFTVP
jgi:hypothetical protein